MTGDGSLDTSFRRSQGGVKRTVPCHPRAGSYPNKELHKDLQALGADGFEIKILEQLENDEDEPKTDYTDDLELLKMIWIEKLTKENVEFY